MNRGRPQGAMTTEQLEEAQRGMRPDERKPMGAPPESTRRPAQEDRPTPPLNRAAAMPQQVQPVRDEQPGTMHHVFAPQQAAEYRRKWQEIQAGFVDDPRNAVQYADQLVADLLQRMVDIFAHEKRSLEGQWTQGEKVSTEDLRVALQRYRGFFERLLTDR